jgi:hypothetical protein
VRTGEDRFDRNVVDDGADVVLEKVRWPLSREDERYGVVVVDHILDVIES